MRIAVDTADWISLSLVEGLGPSVFRQLLSVFGLPGKILAASKYQLAHYTGLEIAGRILVDNPRQSKIDSTLKWLAVEGHALVTLADPAYPKALLQCSNPPPMLFVIGEPNLLATECLAIVGSRNATPQGLINANRFARGLSQAGLTIVSGMALGIDAAAHQGVLDGGGTTIAVLGCGADIVYPRANQKIAREIAARGAIISEFPLGMPPLANNFPKRNRIISGLAKGCLVVEAAAASGSLVTAKLALEQGREVFAIPGSIHSPQSRGCHALIKQGAKLVETAQDILEEFNLCSLSAEPNILKSECPLLQYIGYDPCDLDELQRRCTMPISAITAMLLMLELQGLIASLPGGLYQRLS
ncbi:MAG: DNA-processing protein DprA [Burkholderiales bacterium]